MPTLSANSIDIYYELHGEGEPLVLISGFTEDHTAWDEVLKTLSQSFRVLVFDNRGAGQTTSPKTEFTIKEMADDTVALLNGLKIPKAHILGHSMGGAIAQQIAIDHPQSVLKLIIACSTEKLNPLSLSVIKTGAKLVNANVPFHLLIENVLPWIFSADFLGDKQKMAKAMERKLRNPHPQTLAGYKNQIAACTQYDTSKKLAAIKCPTLVITTEHDILIAPADSKTLAEKISRAQLITIPSSGHIPQVENPDLFCREVIQFLH